MHHIKEYNQFVKSTSNSKFISHIKEPVEIRIDVEAVTHALDRQFRQGSHLSGGKVSPNINVDEIIDTIESSVEQITIDLMQDKFDIYQKEDDYPTRGIKSGDPNRFIIRNKKTDLNIVCHMEPGDNEFKLIVITVMKKPDFKEYRGQYVVEV